MSISLNEVISIEAFIDRIDVICNGEEVDWINDPDWLYHRVLDIRIEASDKGSYVVIEIE